MQTLAQEQLPGRYARLVPVLEVTASVVLLTYLFLAMVHLAPHMPQPGLDASWVQATNFAAAEKLRFGTDVVFTYGPYGSMITGAYHPGVYGLTLLAGTLYVAGLGTALVTLLGRGVLRRFAVIALLPLVPAITHSDLTSTLFLVGPLLMVIAFAMLPGDAERGPRGWRLWMPTILMCASLGLLPAVKVSSLVPVGCAVICMGAIAWLNADRRLAIAVPAVSGLSFLLLWVIAGQSVTSIFGYVRWSIPISSGFSEAMSLREVGPQSPLATVTFVASAALIFAVLGFVARDNLSRVLVTLMWAATSFVAAKEAFVRADGHVVAGWPALAAGILLLLLWKAPWRATISAAALVLLHLHLVVPVLTVPAIAGGYRAVPDELGAVLRGDTASGALKASYQQSLAANRQITPLLKLRGTTDVYPWEASAVFANRLPWRPRPVYQSYSAYTPSLAKLNAEHLSGPRAPKNIVIGLDAIDSRLPALSDGPSWQPLFERYRPNGSATFHLGGNDQRQQVLVKRAVPVHLKAGSPRRVDARLGKWVKVPKTIAGSAILASVDMDATLPGRLRDIVWRPPLVFITLRLSNGTEVEHRFLPRTAKAGFLLSPYADGSTSFGEFYTGAKAMPRVTSFRIETDGAEDALFWSERFSVSLQYLELPRT